MPLLEPVRPRAEVGRHGQEEPGEHPRFPVGGEPLCIEEEVELPKPEAHHEEGEDEIDDPAHARHEDEEREEDHRGQDARRERRVACVAHSDVALNRRDRNAGSGAGSHGPPGRGASGESRATGCP